MNRNTYVLKQDELFMQFAILQAQKAFKKNELPIGAIVVSNAGQILGCGYNKVEKCFSQSKHAEVIAIEKAGKKLQDWRLTNCTIYVTLEPCLMCIGLINLSRIERLVYGANSPIFGYHLDSTVLAGIYKKHIKDVTKGIFANKIVLLLKEFFKNKRKKSE